MMLTTATAARRAGVTRRAVLKEIGLGHLKAEKFGSAWAIDEGDYAAWLAVRVAVHPRCGRPPRKPPKQEAT